MNKLILIFLFFSSVAFSDNSNPLELAKARLKNVGLSDIKFKLAKEMEYSKEQFTIKLDEKAKVYGVEFPPDTMFIISGGIASDTDKRVVDTINVAMLPKGDSIVFQGANCTRLEFDRGDLIQCALAEDAAYKDLLIPKGTQLHYDRKLKKDNIAIPVLISNLTKNSVFKGKEFKARTGLLRITDGGDVVKDGASKLFEKIHSQVGI